MTTQTCLQVNSGALGNRGHGGGHVGETAAEHVGLLLMTTILWNVEIQIYVGMQVVFSD